MVAVTSPDWARPGVAIWQAAALCRSLQHQVFSWLVTLCGRNFSSFPQYNCTKEQQTMPHPKRVRAGAHSPDVPVKGQANTTKSTAEGPPNLNTAVSSLQPTVLRPSSVCDKQAQQEQEAPSIQTKSSAAGAKALPVLPWMRVPISIEGGTGVPLSQVTGLHPLALAALHAGMY